MKGKTPTGRWVVKRLIRVLNEVLHESDPDTARMNLIGASLGVITSLQLLLRLATSGQIVLVASPVAIDAIEEFSDALAEEFFDQLAGEVAGVGTLHGRLGMSRFTRAGDTLTFRLAPPLDVDEIAPAELQETSALSGIADRVVGRTMTLLERTMRPLHGKAIILGKISFIIGFTALAKILMAYWGQGPLASGIEAIAEIDSDARYRELVSRVRQN